MMTQSVGVPFTAKRRASTSRRRSGRLSESEWDTPDWSVSGATTHTSSESTRAIFSSTSRPGAKMPSSLVNRMRISFFLGAWSFPKTGSHFSGSYAWGALDPLYAAHVGLEHIRHRDAAALVLIGLHHRNER